MDRSEVGNLLLYSIYKNTKRPGNMDQNLPFLLKTSRIHAGFKKADARIRSATVWPLGNMHNSKFQSLRRYLTAESSFLTRNWSRRKNDRRKQGACMRGNLNRCHQTACNNGVHRTTSMQKRRFRSVSAQNVRRPFAKGRRTIHTPAETPRPRAVKDYWGKDF